MFYKITLDELVRLIYVFLIKKMFCQSHSLKRFMMENLIHFLVSADELDLKKIPKKTYVVYFGHHGDRAVKRADLIVPISCFTEKEGVYVNLEIRPQISR